MQNKPNFKMGNMTVSTATLKAYAKKQRTMSNERYSKQTQSNPISIDQSLFQTQRQFSGAKNRALQHLPHERLPRRPPKRKTPSLSYQATDLLLPLLPIIVSFCQSRSPLVASLTFN